ncbi:hypothetical protein [Hymenobacter weizhouensis]|uniref:hypothetical protein n=1 Tax=Hymenobacter sp. YIM 151500-1 TaxID=2987689 RepID=UPI00222633C8|nr:hypothetical protein [Hymenobacter sp. YIM 151500-1]UYZ62335.1 hypothetical protein OIS53_15210 [Hymenobacter sp. YIM 151500-1]
MLTQYLFPHRFKRLGLVLTGVSLVAGLLELYEAIKLPKLLAWLPAGLGDWAPFPGPERANHDLWALLFIVGGVLAACSREQVEDEYIAKIRLASLLWAFYLYYALLALSFLLFSGTAFLSVMLYAMFAPLLLFLVRFHLALLLGANKAVYEE